MRSFLLVVISSALALIISGCAHNKPVEPIAAPSAPITTVTPAPVVPAQTTDVSALAAVLKGAVLHFDFDQALLSPESEGKLQKVSEALKAGSNVPIKIAGHCDERGTAEYNIALGQRRAEVAKKYLVALGVDATRVDTVSFGAEQPAQPGHDEKAWAENRRDELQIAK